MGSALDRRTFLRAGALALPASVAWLLAACTDEDPTGAVTPRPGEVGRAGSDHGGSGPRVDRHGIATLDP